MTRLSLAAVTLLMVTGTSVALAGPQGGFKFQGGNNGGQRGHVAQFQHRPQIQLHNQNHGFKGIRHHQHLNKHVQHQIHTPHIQHGLGFNKHIGHNHHNHGFKTQGFGFGNRLYHQQHGVYKNFGYCYVGSHHCHWQTTNYYPSYGCNLYFDPCTSVWYYWCTPDNCFYPISHCPYGVYAF